MTITLTVGPVISKLGPSFSKGVFPRSTNGIRSREDGKILLYCLEVHLFVSCHCFGIVSGSTDVFICLSDAE